MTVRLLTAPDGTAAADAATATVRHSRPDWTGFLLLTVAAAGVLFVGYGDAPATLLTSAWLLLTGATGLVLLWRPGDLLAPIKQITGLWALSFAALPVLLYGTGEYEHPYFGNRADELLIHASLLCLYGAMLILLGHVVTSAALTGTGAGGPTDPRGARLSAHLRAPVLLAAATLAVLGTLSYGVLVMSSGGLAFLLGYSGGRAELFSGTFGGWFWGTHLLLGAYGLFAVVFMPTRPFLCLGLAVLLSAAFFPLQGRDLLLAPLFSWIVFLHAVRRPLGRWSLALGAASAAIAASLLGAYRRSADREDLVEFLRSFVFDIGANLGDVSHKSVEQLDAVMTAQRFLDKGGDAFGGSVLTLWLEPFDRLLLGDVLDSANSGVILDRLVFPEHYGSATAISPSLPGELLLAGGATGLVIGCLAYGALAALMHQWFRSRGRVPLLFAAYPFVLYMFVKMIVDGSQHLFRALIVLGAVAGCAALVSVLAGRSPAPGLGASPVPGRRDARTVPAPPLRRANLLD